jgi:hypothetical protein
MLHGGEQVAPAEGAEQHPGEVERQRQREVAVIGRAEGGAHLAEVLAAHRQGDEGEADQQAEPEAPVTEHGECREKREERREKGEGKGAECRVPSAE